ncbi:MAG: penicillin-binding protein 1A [Betaproteobacteria bacterium]|nr:MAG: penicillin-binding protein 1A [Betaproteobacteria bacterium]
MLKRWLIYLASVLFGLALVGTLLVAFVFALLYPSLPTLEALTDYQPKIPLRIVSADGELLGEFGEERRAVVKIRDVPEVMRQAILAAEDERFYQHGGVDYISVLRAALTNLTSGTQQGAGTITMQVARNFFLTRERTLTRKLREVLLAYKIEANLTKDEILELYINQIFLGQRAYGFAAAAQMYFGKPLSQIDVAEAAMLAGLPKAPSAYNPVANPKRARTRQLYVLRRMHELRFINDAQLQHALAAPLVVHPTLHESLAHADYAAEMARQTIFETYGEDSYSRGLTVYTTIRKADQDAAYAAVRRGVIDYDRRHGYRGPEAYVSLPNDPAELDGALDQAFQDLDDSDNLDPAIVLAAGPTEIKAVRSDGEAVSVTGDGLKFAARALSDKAPAGNRIRRGAVIRLSRDDKGRWQIAQLPQAESALISARPSDGAILALVGGFDFERNKFNHATQALRQPGSAFKPFIYSAALEKGFSPATVVIDGPLYFDASETGSEPWEPKNYDGKYEGPMRLRTALMKSKNLVTVRVMRAIGTHYAQDYIARFGFDPKLHPPYLPMALGAGAATPVQMLGAYSVFANGGYRVAPYLIDKVLDSHGNVLSRAQPAIAEQNAERVIDPRNAFIMTTMMRDVVRAGTAARAMQLGRQDLAGKTGTTNENVDAWFCGFNASMVAVAWIGFDQPRTLGTNETGAVAALPIWMNFMAKVLKGVPEQPLAPPEGVLVARINPESGLRELDDRGGIVEYFYSEFPPKLREDVLVPGATRVPGEIRNQLF